nr:reverse transcriptase domain-containing protein [Tanacetum cinerariifolium]
MVLATTSLTGFSGETIWPLGQLRLLVTIGDATHSTKAWMNFMVVKSMSPYNGSSDWGSLSDKGRTELCSVLKKNLDIFAWQPSDMTGVPRSVVEHRLNIREGYTPVWQKKMGQAPERARAIQAEVQKLIDARIMREVYYHDWLSNPVMVKKHDESWRMCVDFTDLNRACPQDCYPLPKIDWKRLMDKAFKSQFGRNIEVYVDDLVVKSHTEAEMSDFRWTAEAEQAFQQLKQHLSELPLLVAPKPQEELIMYLSATYGAVSAVLMTERGTTQMPIYFISLALQGPELNYSPMEKLVLAAAKVEHYAGRAQYYIQTEDVITQEEPWTLFTDGSSCVDGSGAGLILTNPEGVEFTYALRFQFAASNNEAEYKTLVVGLRIATQMGVKNIQVLVEVLENKSLKEKEVAAVIEEDGPTWMTHIADYLKDGVLPGNNKEARKLPLKARQYELMKGVLYRRSFLTPWLRCVGPLQADYVTREIHEGSYSMQAGPRSVLAKAIRLGYYWPTRHKDARDMIRKCNDCQIHRPGIDIAGPFPEGLGKVKFLIVAMDYFTKWIEAKAVAMITGGQVKKFVWDNIICRFGIPGEIISDNGKQFADNPFKDWCDNLNITQRFASVKHPKSNGLVERANRSLGEGIKAHLGEVIPTEIGMPTYRTAAVDVVNNDKELRLNLDLLEERRERAAVCKARAKSKMMEYYNAKVRGVAFKPVAGGKLGPK